MCFILFPWAVSVCRVFILYLCYYVIFIYLCYIDYLSFIIDLYFIIYFVWDSSIWALLFLQPHLTPDLFPTADRYWSGTGTLCDVGSWRRAAPFLFVSNIVVFIFNIVTRMQQQ